MDTKIKCMSFLYQYMGNNNFGLNVVAAILKFKMYVFEPKPVDSLLYAMIEFCNRGTQ